MGIQSKKKEEIEKMSSISEPPLCCIMITNKDLTPPHYSYTHYSQLYHVISLHVWTLV